MAKTLVLQLKSRFHNWNSGLIAEIVVWQINAQSVFPIETLVWRNNVQNGFPMEAILHINSSNQGFSG